MVDQRHGRAVDEGLRVLGRRTAHDQKAGEAGRARHAGQALDRTQRVAAGAGDALDLAALDHAARDLARRTFADHRDLELTGVRFLRRDAVGDLGLLAGHDLFFLLGGVEPGGGDADAVVARGNAHHGPAALAVGLNAPGGPVRPGHDHFGARERNVRLDDADLALQIADLLLGRSRCRRDARSRRDGLGGLQGEVVLVENLNLRRLPVHGRGLEHELEHRCLRRFVEAVAGRLHYLGRRHLAGGVDRQLEHGVPFETRLLRFGRIRRVLEMNQLRHHDRRLLWRRLLLVRLRGAHDGTRSAARDRSLSTLGQRFDREQRGGCQRCHPEPREVGQDDVSPTLANRRGGQAAGRRIANAKAPT